MTVMKIPNKFITRKIVVKAEQWFEGQSNSMIKTRGGGHDMPSYSLMLFHSCELKIHSGDWIVENENGDIKVIRPNVFGMFFEPLSELPEWSKND